MTQRASVRVCKRFLIPAQCVELLSCLMGTSGSSNNCKELWDRRASQPSTEKSKTQTETQTSIYKLYKTRTCRDRSQVSSLIKQTMSAQVYSNHPLRIRGFNMFGAVHWLGWLSLRKSYVIGHLATRYATCLHSKHLTNRKAIQVGHTHVLLSHYQGPVDDDG